MTFDVLDFLVGPATKPFSIAECILIGMTLLEIVALTIGTSLSAKLDAILHLDHAEADAHVGGAHDGIHAAEHGLFETVWDWFNKGRVPLLILLMIMLGVFGATGHALQGVAHATIGYLPTGLACLIAGIVTIPITRRITRIVGRIVPRDETYVIHNEDLIGTVVTITLGPVTDQEIGRSRLLDRHGNQHFPWVRGANQNMRIEEGARALIVSRKGNEYLVVPAEQA